MLSVEPVPLVFRFVDIGPLTAFERLLDVLGQEERSIGAMGDT